MDLLEIRGRLDQIDTQIEKLFEERMRLCSEVAEYKIATGKAVYDAEREKQKIESVQAMAEGEFNKQAVAELFLQMMTLSRRYQYQTIAGRVGGPDLGFHKVEKLETAGKRVVFQGLEGAYGHAAALQFFGKDADIHHVRRFEDMMVEIQEGKADFAVLPIENSSAGAVTDNYDLLLKYDNVIVAETFLPVHHYLLGTPDAELSDVKRVYAHPQALMQSSDFLNQHDWQQLSMENNAVAACLDFQCFRYLRHFRHSDFRHSRNYRYFQNYCYFRNYCYFQNYCCFQSPPNGCRRNCRNSPNRLLIRCFRCRLLPGCSRNLYPHGSGPLHFH